MTPFHSINAEGRSSRNLQEENSLQAVVYDLSPAVFAFSTCRSGGVSRGAYASMNVNPYCGDVPADVSENRRRLSAWLGTENILLPHQVHGTRVAFVAGGEKLEGYDALVTQQARLCICVSTADCIPILLYDAETKSVAAVHAGWRGTAARIVEKVIAEMTARLGTRPSALRAVIGPGISLEAFEVGDEVYEAFRAADFPMQRIARRMERWHIDLWEANRWQLQQLGVEDVHVSGICTYNNADRFFSARRLGTESGRILNGIMLKP